MIHVLILASILNTGSADAVPELALLQTSRNSDVLAFVEEMVQGTVARASGHNWTMTEEEKEAIEHAKQVIRDMVNTSLVQHAEDQAEVDRARDLIENCSTLTKAHLDTSAGALLQQSSLSREQHSMCRTREVFLYAEWDRICGIYNTYRQHNESALLPTCATTAALSDEYIQTDDLPTLKIMEECLVAMHLWNPALYKPYKACEEAEEEAANCTARCNIKQRHFETGFCEYIVRLEDVCNYQEQCRAMTIAARHSTHESVHISVSARKSDHTAASKILCLFDVLDIEDAADKKRLLHECDSRNHSVDNALFFIDYHDIPPPYPCDASAARPGDDDWFPEAYGHETWFGAVDLVVPEKCSQDDLADLEDDSLLFGLHGDADEKDAADKPNTVLLSVDSDARIAHAHHIKEAIVKWQGSHALANGQQLLGLGKNAKLKAEQVHHNKERAVSHRLHEVHKGAQAAQHVSHIPKAARKVTDKHVPKSARTAVYL